MSIDEQMDVLRQMYLRGIARCDEVLSEMSENHVPSGNPIRASRRAMAERSRPPSRTGHLVSERGRKNMAAAQRKRREREWAEKVVGAIHP